MANLSLERRLKKQLRLNRQRAEDLTKRTGQGIDKNLIRRLEQLTSVRRFISVWLILAVLLIGTVVTQIISLSGYYQTLAPASGGVYTEGILGDFTNANPIYATNPVDTAVSDLVFSGLLKYNDQNQLVDNLASSWSVNSIGNVYTVILKPNLRWQDGAKLTAQDVAFTYHVIQNADAQSPLESSWQGINVNAVNDTTIVFTLPNPLSSFPYSLTTGIIPEHILGNIPTTELRSSTFNTLDPVGSGPFEFKAIEAYGDTPQTRGENIELLPFSGYTGGQPKLNEMVIRAFHDQDAMLTSFRQQELTGMAGLSSVPSDLTKNSGVNIYNFILTAEKMVFFKNSSGILADTKVRQSLVLGADTYTLISGLGYPTIPVNESLLLNQLGYNLTYRQFSFDPIAAAQELTSDGWILNSNGIRYKSGQPLEFTISSADDPEDVYDATTLQKDWQAIGVKVDLSFQDSTTLQNTVENHSYDALLYGISIGIDPDVYVYWDSTQFDPRSPVRLNLSEFDSSIADDSLEEGRTRIDPALRIIKYQPFLQAWQQNAPALGLYQPRFIYITRGDVYGLNQHTINTGTDRFSNVQNWEIREVKTSR